ncbi:hypothetical protein Tco_1217118 [Tanacetum coccineum]
MTTARDTQPPYQTTASARGKLRKTLLQQKKNLNMLTKIVDRVYKLFCVVFGNRKPSAFMRTKTTQEEGQRGNSAATRISDLEQMLQQKTFTRSEIERLKALLLSRSNESSSTDVVERNGANLYSSPSSKVALRQALVLHNNATGL